MRYMTFVLNEIYEFCFENDCCFFFVGIGRIEPTYLINMLENVEYYEIWGRFSLIISKKIAKLEDINQNIDPCG